MTRRRAPKGHLWGGAAKSVAQKLSMANENFPMFGMEILGLVQLLPQCFRLGDRSVADETAADIGC